MKSSEVYSDCLRSKQMFESAVESNNLSEARILWFSTLALLRAIGHVLNKIDVKSRSPDFEKAVQARYNNWKSNKIFSEFIQDERNAILKEYDSSLEVMPQSVTHNVTYRGEQVTHKGVNVVHTVTILQLVKFKGAFAGESPVEVLEKALQWWQRELNELEKIP